MIFHTAAEQLYFDLFFQNWHTSIKKFWPGARFSLRFIGPKSVRVDEYCKTNDIIVTHDPITFEEIKTKFDQVELPEKDKRPKACYGYYAISRWLSMPVVDDHVGLTDVDIVAVKKPDMKKISKIFNEHQQYRLPRVFVDKTRPKNMMVNFFRKDVVSEVNEVAANILNSSKLMWCLDLGVMDYCNKHFNIFDEGLLAKFKTAIVPKNNLFGYYAATDFVDSKGKLHTGALAKAARYKQFFDLNSL
jgi:hypothetical protein